MIAVEVDERKDVDDLAFHVPSVVGFEADVPPSLTLRNVAVHASECVEDPDRRKPHPPEPKRRTLTEQDRELDVAPSKPGACRNKGQAHEYIPATSVSFVCGSLRRMAPTMTV